MSSLSKQLNYWEALLDILVYACPNDSGEQTSTSGKLLRNIIIDHLLTKLVGGRYPQYQNYENMGVSKKRGTVPQNAWL